MYIFRQRPNIYYRTFLDLMVKSEEENISEETIEENDGEDVDELAEDLHEDDAFVEVKDKSKTKEEENEATDVEAELELERGKKPAQRRDEDEEKEDSESNTEEEEEIVEE